MNEIQWTHSICELLSTHNLGEGIGVTTLQKLPYAYEINAFTPNWAVATSHATVFETDLLVYQRRDNQCIPRVIIEVKLGSVTTHDAITYSNKAAYHKQVMPYLRYGIILGDRSTYPLPGRLFRHGTHFDFLFSFVGTEPSTLETYTFIEMLRKEVIYSQQMEEILNNSRNKSRKHYFMLQKEFHLEEMDE